MTDPSTEHEPPSTGTTSTAALAKPAVPAQRSAPAAETGPGRSGNTGRRPRQRTRPDWQHVAWAADLARLAGPGKVTSVKVPAALVARAALVVRRSTLPDWFDSYLPAQTERPTGGRVRVLGVEALLIGVLLLAMTGQPMMLRALVALLNDLHPSTKHLHGIPAEVTERMVSRLFNQMIAVVDPSPHTRNNLLRRRAGHDAIRDAHPGDDPATRALRKKLHQELEAQYAAGLAQRAQRLAWLLSRGLDATLPDDPHTGSYAVDASECESWSVQHRKQPRRPELYPDPDARWNGKGKHKRGSWFGYWLHGVVRLDEVGGEKTPCFVERIALTAANADVRTAGLGLLTAMVADHERADEAAGRPHRARRDVIADPAYTSETNQADDWIWPLFDLGFDSVHRLTKHQLGQRKKPLASGAIVIDGQPYSPRTPKHLRRLPFPKPGWTRQQIQDYIDQAEKRRPWMLTPHGERRADGSWRFGCPAMTLLGKVRCGYKPDSLAAAPTATRPTADPALFHPRKLDPKLHAICLQQTATVPAADLPFWQPTPFGTRDWWNSWNRRNRVEGLFGNIKNDAAQNLTRGRIRVMGLAKTSFMVLFVAMAANLRLADTFAEREAAGTPAAEPAPRAGKAGAGKASGTSVKKKRTPPFRTQLREEMRERIAAARQAAEAQDARAGTGTGGSGAPPTP